ncbi:MAG: shikimate dehydrogenase, partial [Pseudomonadota bacterium]
TFEADGVVADNSDVYGFQMALDNARASAVGPALVLGAGGAARAVVVALLAAGFGPVRVANRTAARAEALAGDLGAEPVAWDRRTAGLTDAAVLVNATSLGMTGAPALAFDLANAAASLVVCDIVYSPLQTPLLRAAHARGLRVVDGLDMLMRQAEPGFRRWFGAEPRVDAALRARLVAVLEARG